MFDVSAIFLTSSENFGASPPLGPLDVVPVSDPAIFSETQRFAQIQAIMQRAAIAPQMYDARKVEELFLRTLKIPSADVLQPKPASSDLDPVSENLS